MNPNRGHYPVDKIRRNYRSQKGKGSLNPPHKGRDNESMEGKGEQEKN